MNPSFITRLGRVLRRLRFGAGRTLPILSDLGASASGNVLVRCKEGHAWVTQQNDPQDHILGRGDSMALNLSRHPTISLAKTSLVELSYDLPS